MSIACQRCKELTLTRWICRSSSITGESSSTGVIRPVRPILKLTLRTSARAWAKGYFQATLQSGGLACQRSAEGRLPWRKTIPSLAKGRGEWYQRSRQRSASEKASIAWLKTAVSAKPSSWSLAMRSGKCAGPSGHSQTNRPTPAACSALNRLRAINPATVARALRLPARDCT
ncbi:hypothetical protein D9M70_526620 [compost metagenome]